MAFQRRSVATASRTKLGCFKERDGWMDGWRDGRKDEGLEDKPCEFSTELTFLDEGPEGMPDKNGYGRRPSSWQPSLAWRE